MSLIGALLLASVVEIIENPRSVSPNGEYVAVVRQLEVLDDFESVSQEEYSRRWDERWEANEAAGNAKAPEPLRVAIYRNWPGDYRQLLAEFSYENDESHEKLAVTNDGFVLTYGPVVCGAKANLLTIRTAYGELVRAVPVRDAMTVNDHQWLCRGSASDVQFAVDDRTFRMTMLVSGEDDPAGPRYETVEIDVETGKVPAPTKDHCPAALLVIPQGYDAGGQLLLTRAVKQVQPEYPDVASKARVSGLVRVRIVVGADGKVKSSTITKPLPFGLDQAVQTAIPQWEFEPGEAMTGEITFRFEIVRHVRLVTMY
jgi:TonB family protein